LSLFNLNRAGHVFHIFLIKRELVLQTPNHVPLSNHQSVNYFDCVGNIFKLTLGSRRKTYIACDAYYACVTAMKTENILNKANLAFPDDIVLLEPEIIAKRLQEKAGIQEKELPETLSNLFESAITSERFAETIPPGLTEGTVNAFKILVTTRLANFIRTVEPSIMKIANLSKLSRNFVSPYVTSLESFDLISTKPHMRGQLVFPTRLTTLYIDVVSGNLEKEYGRLKTVAKEVKRGELSGESLKFLEDLETAFHMTKLAYNESTVNYEIFEDLHNRVRELVVSARQSKNEEIIKNLDEFLDILGHIISVREKAKKMGVRPVILEDTKERLGRARVFRVK